MIEFPASDVVRLSEAGQILRLSRERVRQLVKAKRLHAYDRPPSEERKEDGCARSYRVLLRSDVEQFARLRISPVIHPSLDIAIWYRGKVSICRSREDWERVSAYITQVIRRSKDSVLDDTLRTCPECGHDFSSPPRRGGRQKYCSDTCKNRMNMRKYWQRKLGVTEAENRAS